MSIVSSKEEKDGYKFGYNQGRSVKRVEGTWGTVQ